MAKQVDDQVFKKAKTKLGEMIEKADNVADVVKLCETLAKMKDVELKADEGAFGSGLDK
jgi:hypothetical protein